MGELYDPTWLIVQGTWSPTWRSIVVGIRDVIVSGMRWILGDGRRVRFWKDKWLLDEPLQKSSMVQIPEPILEARACDLWQNGTGWLLQVIESYMSIHDRLRLAAIVIDEVTGARDRMSWGESKDGLFSVKSASAF